MKSFLIAGLLLIGFSNCSEKKEAVSFVSLPESEFNATTLKIPDNQMVDSMKHAHDSCMGFSFAANAMLVNRKDSLSIGNIINRQSLKTAGTLAELGLSSAQLMSQFNVITNPCYEKRIMNLPLASILGDSFRLQLPGTSEAINQEINTAITSSKNVEIQSGSWVYLDMKDALQTILDTIQSPAGLQYKRDALDTSNMVLTTMESVTDVNFIIHTGKILSAPVQALLQTKPSVATPHSPFSIRLSYIDDTQLEMSLNGFFPLAGQFVKAELK